MRWMAVELGSTVRLVDVGEGSKTGVEDSKREEEEEWYDVAMVLVMTGVVETGMDTGPAAQNDYVISMIL